MGVDLSPAAPAPAALPAPGPDRAVRGRRSVPGTILAWASVAPGLVLTGWLVAAYPLARVSLVTPLVAVPAAMAAIALLLVLARRLPAVPDTPWWSVVATLGVGVAFTAYTAAHASGHVVLRRDSAVYALLARWIADTGGLALPVDLAAIGGPTPLAQVASPGFYYAGGDRLAVQFMSGTALSLAPAGLGGGFTGILFLPALFAGAALVAVGGLAGRLIGARWAPVAALLLGLAQPVMLTARSTYSEPVVQLLSAAALCLLLDAVARVRRPLGLLAGLVLGIGLLVRVDALRDLALLVPVVAWLAVKRHPVWPWLTGGALLGTAYGVADADGPSRAYVTDMWPSIRPGAYAVAGFVALALVAVPAWRVLLPRLRSLAWWEPLRRWAAWGAAAATALVAVGFAVRPYLGPAYGAGNAYRFIESLQLEQGLPVDPDRAYQEQSVRWVSWFLGWPALALAAAAATVLVWRAVRGERDGRRWTLALSVPLLTAVSVLWKPAITPDHPWADRRLVPAVLPVVVLLSLWAVAALARYARSRSAWLGPVVVAAGLVVLLVPAEAGSKALRGSVTEAGEPAAVAAACTAFRPGDVAVLVDARTRQEWAAPIRMVCGVPAFGVPGYRTDDTATVAELAPVVARVRGAGFRPVLVAQSGEPLPRLTTAPQRQVVDLDTKEHRRILMSSPRDLADLSIELWIAEP